MIIVAQVHLIMGLALLRAVKDEIPLCFKAKKPTF
jgi:hypothetical protein